MLASAQEGGRLMVDKGLSTSLIVNKTHFVRDRLLSLFSWAWVLSR